MKISELAFFNCSSVRCCHGEIQNLLILIKTYLFNWITCFNRNQNQSFDCKLTVKAHNASELSLTRNTAFALTFLFPILAFCHHLSTKLHNAATFILYPHFPSPTITPAPSSSLNLLSISSHFPTQKIKRKFSIITNKIALLL